MIGTKLKIISLSIKFIEFSIQYWGVDYKNYVSP